MHAAGTIWWKSLAITQGWSIVLLYFSCLVSLDNSLLCHSLIIKENERISLVAYFSTSPCAISFRLPMLWQFLAAKPTHHFSDKYSCTCTRGGSSGYGQMAIRLGSLDSRVLVSTSTMGTWWEGGWVGPTAVFRTVQSVSLGGRTGRTTGGSSSFSSLWTTMGNGAGTGYPMGPCVEFSYLDLF